MARILDRGEWQHWIILIDLIVIGIFIAGIYLIAHDAYISGFYLGQNNYYKHDIAFWKLIRDVVFTVISGIWIFFRLFRNEFEILKLLW